MIARYAALVVCAAGCGKVATRSGGDAAVDGATTDAPTATSGMYRGTLDQTAAVTFGGPTGTINYCHYTITLKDLVVQIGLLPNGQVRTGQVQDTNVEATVPPCSLMPIPPGAAFYDFLSPGTAINMPLTFIGAAANVPAVSLTVELSPTDPGYQARLTFHRTDQSAPFDWTVVTTVALSTP